MLWNNRNFSGKVNFTATYNNNSIHYGDYATFSKEYQFVDE